MQFILKKIEGNCYERFATVTSVEDGRDYNVRFIEIDECLGENGDGEIHKRKVGDVLNATLCIESEGNVVKGGEDELKPENDTSYFVTALVKIKNKVDDDDDDNVYMADASWSAELVKVYMYENNDFKVGDYLTLDGSLELEIEE